MNKKKQICMMLIVILIMQIILPTLTVVLESELTLKSIAEGTLETTVNGITWTYILKEEKATEVKPKDKTSLSGSVIIPSQLDGYTVTSIGDYAFNGCSNLTSIEIPSGVTNIGSFVFKGCRSLTSIEIPEGVISIGELTFYECSSLTKIEIPEGVTSIGDRTFYGCSNLTSIEIPNGVTKIGYGAFEYCSNLISIEIPEGVIFIGDWAFDKCNSLISIEVNEKNTRYKSDNGVLYTKYGNGLICYPAKREGAEYIIPDRVEWIEAYAFSGCSSLTSIKIPNGVTRIGQSAFDGCSSLTSIKIPEGVTSIRSSTFEDCSSLTSIKIPEGVTSIGYGAFFNCSNLTSINIPSGVTSIESCVFRGCSSLTSIEIPEGVTSIGSVAFSDCNSLISIKIPDRVTSIGDMAFSGCSNLKIYCKSDSFAESYAISKNIPYIIDDVSPIIISVMGNTDEWTKENVTLTVNAEDNISGLAKKAYSFDGGITWQESNSKTYTENTNNIVIKVKDKLNNITTYEKIDITKIMKLTGITVTKAPTKTTYLEAQNFDKTGMIVTATYNNGSTQAITNYTITDGNNLTAGKTSVTISYTENGVTKTVAQGITVQAKELTGITVTKAPTKTAYIEGQNFDKTGMLVTATYDNGSTQAVTNYTITDENNLALGKTSVTISYTENGVTKTATQGITVQAKSLTGITVTNVPTKTTYIEGQNFDKTGMVVTALYNNGSTQAVTNYTIADGNNLAAGKTSVTISYIENGVTKAPTKTTYIEGQNFDKTGMIVTATYNNGSSKEITNYTITDGNNLTAGKTSVTMSYTENGVTKTVAQGITVQAKTLTGITVTKAPIKTIYFEGQNFDKTGMIVTAMYDNGSSEEITNYTITDGNNLTLGKTSVIISYIENGVTKTVTQGITVTKKLEIKLDVYEEKQEGTTKYVGNIKPETTIENILTDIDTNGTVEIYKGTSKITDLNTKIGTGMVIKISLNNEKIEYTAVVTGDLNGDGLMGDIDVLRMARYKAGLDNSLNGAYLQASNIHKDNNYADDIDLLKMVRILVGLDTI